MRRILTVVLAVTLLFTFTYTANAGEMLAKGAKLGLNMASLGGDDAPDNKMKMGIALGGFIEYGITDMIIVAPELLFSMKGCTYDAPSDPVLGLNYIDIVIPFKYYIGESDFKPNVFLGPSIGLLMSADSDGTDVKDSTKGTDFGLVFGAGGIYNQFTFDLRYAMGLTSIDDSGFDLKMTNTVISIMVGYMF
ncbi:PorT family protein [bacterium]|nr:PorT family protein [bacterium]